MSYANYGYRGYPPPQHYQQRPQRPPQYRANYAYAQSSVVDEMARHYRVNFNPNGVSGLSRTDTFRQSRTLTSSRYYNEAPLGNRILKGLGSFVSGLASVIGIAGYFYPPAMAVAQVAGPISTAVNMGTANIDVRPRAVQAQVVSGNNFWFR